MAVDTAVLASKRQSSKAPAIDLELARAKSERKSLDRLRERLMRDLLAGVLGKEDHDRMKWRYAQEGQALEEQITRLQKEQRREKKLLTSQNPWMAAFQKHTGMVKLTDKLVQALVERITVYANNRIEIELKHRDERAMLLDELQKMDKEASA